METSQRLLELEMPVGYRFVPTDEELVKYYLANKVLYKPLPVKIIREIDAHDLYSKHPKCLVGNGTFNDNEREWFFFIYKDEYFLGKTRSTRMVGNGIGFWRFIGEEEPIHNSEGDIFAFKIYLTYFSGSPPHAKKTHWRMEEYRLQTEINGRNKQEVQECILARIIRGRNYTDSI
ncbi:protein SOMBRERO-like [Coffea arabica]|uniref:Protein SOMBRERO-like n=1 Tax=Coffea arabica TaxID=13443 RepID=A0ABM4U6E5_COFAR